jgi:hypothetical protein
METAWAVARPPSKRKAGRAAREREGRWVDLGFMGEGNLIGDEPDVILNLEWGMKT